MEAELSDSIARQHARFRMEVRNMEQECKSLRQRLLFSAGGAKRAQAFVERAEALSTEISMVSDASLAGDTPVIEAEDQILLEEVAGIEQEYQEILERLPMSAGTATRAREMTLRMQDLARRFSVLRQKEESRANLSALGESFIDFSDEDVFPDGSPLFSESSNPSSRIRSARSFSASGSEIRPQSGTMRPVSAKSVGFSTGSDRPHSARLTNPLSPAPSFRTAIESDPADSVISERTERTDPDPAWICGEAAVSDGEENSDAEEEKEEEKRDEKELAALVERMGSLEEECQALRKRMLYTRNVTEDAVELRRRLKELSQLLSEKARKERRRNKAKAARAFRKQVKREARSIQQQIQQLQNLTTWNASGELNATTDEVDRALDLSMNLASLNRTLSEMEEEGPDRSESSASSVSRRSGSMRGSRPPSTYRSGRVRLGSAKGRPVSARRKVWRSEARQETMERFQLILSSCVAVQAKQQPIREADAPDGRALVAGIFAFMLDPDAPHPIDDVATIEDVLEDENAKTEAEEDSKTEEAEEAAEPELKPLKPWVDLRIGEEEVKGRRIHPGRFEAIEGLAVKVRPARAQVDVTNTEAIKGQIAIVEGDPADLLKGKVSNLVKVERCVRAGATAVLIRHDAQSADFENIDFEHNPWPTNLLAVPVLALSPEAGEALVEGVAVSITDGASRPTSPEADVIDMDKAAKKREEERTYGLEQGMLHHGLMERMGLGVLERLGAREGGKLDGLRMPKLLGLREFQKAYEEQGAVIEAARKISANEKLVDGLVARIQAAQKARQEKAKKEQELKEQAQFRSLNRFGSSMRLLTTSMQGQSQMTTIGQSRMTLVLEDEEEPPRQDPSVSEQVFSLACTLWEVKRQFEPCTTCGCGGHLADRPEQGSLATPACADENHADDDGPSSNQSAVPVPTNSEVQMWNLGLLAREQIRPVLRTALLVAVDTAYRGEGGETEIAMLVAAKVKDLYPSLQRPATGDTGIGIKSNAVRIPEDEEKKKWTIFMSGAMGVLVENLRTEAKLEEKGEDLGVLHSKKEQLEQQIGDAREQIERIEATGQVAAQIQKAWRGYVYRVLLRRKGFPCAVSPIERQMREWVHLLAITLGTGILVRRDEDGGAYIGQVNADMEPNGVGIMTFAPKQDNTDGPQVYIGAFQSAKMEGLGIMWWTSGNIYQGSWLNDMPHGKGTELYANGSVYQGGFKTDRRSGYGAYSFSNGTSYGGQWSGGIPHGMGIQVPRGGSSLDDGELALFDRGGPQKLPKEKRHKVETFVEVILGVHIAIQEGKELSDRARDLAASASRMFGNVLRASNTVPDVTTLYRAPPAHRPSILDEEFGALPLRRPSFPFAASRGKTPRSRGMTPKQGSRPGTAALAELGQKVSALHSAALAGDEAKVLALVKAGEDLNAGDVDGLTPLHYAAGDGHVVIVAFLLEAGADVMAADKEGDLALHVAVQEGQLAVVELLLSRFPALVDARGAWQNTALHLAAGSSEHLSDMLACLLARGADPHLENDEGDSAIELARRVVTTIDEHPHYKILLEHTGEDDDGAAAAAPEGVMGAFVDETKLTINQAARTLSSWV